MERLNAGEITNVVLNLVGDYVTNDDKVNVEANKKLEILFDVVENLVHEIADISDECFFSKSIAKERQGDMATEFLKDLQETISLRLSNDFWW